MEYASVTLLSFLGGYLLVSIAAIVVGLLIFVKGRDHVHKKYGKK